MEVSAETFVKEWYACWEDPTRDLGYLIQISEPIFRYWEELLTSDTGFNDVNFVSLCAKLSYNPEDSLNSIRRWVAWCELNSSVYEELILIFITHIRQAKYFPSFSPPYRTEFLIAYDYKLKIRESMWKPKIKEVEYHLNGGYTYDTKVEYAIPDFLLFKNLALTRWQNYLLMWLRTGKETTEIASATSVPRRTLAREEKYLWHLLEKNYYEPEELAIRRH